jgi:hypothetical protein
VLSETDEDQKEGEDAEDERPEKGKKSVLFNVNVRREFLQKMQKAVEASKGKYATKSELARDAIEEKVTWIEAGMPEPESDDDWMTNKEPPAKRDKELERQEKILLKIVGEELGNVDLFGDADDFTERVKGAKLTGKSTLFSLNSVQKSMRLRLRDLVCPAGFWDSKRKWNPKEGAKLIETFRKQLQIPRSVAAGLVKDSECDTSQCKSCPHSEERKKAKVKEPEDAEDRELFGEEEGKKQPERKGDEAEESKEEGEEEEE